MSISITANYLCGLGWGGRGWHLCNTAAGLEVHYCFSYPVWIATIAGFIFLVLFHFLVQQNPKYVTPAG